MPTHPYYAISFTNESKEDWRQFVDLCPEAWLYHRPEMVEGAIDGKEYADWSFSIRRNGEIVGVCVLMRDSIGMGACLSGPGLALSPHTSRKETTLFAEEIIRQLAGKGGCQAVRFHLSPLAPGLVGQRYHESTLAELSFSFGVRGDNLDYQTSYANMIDLSKDLGEILKGFTKGNRANVTKCAAMPFTVDIVAGDAVSDRQWSDFVDLHRLTFERNSLHTFDEKRLGRLRCAVSEGHIALVSAYKADNCIASIMLEMYKQGLSYSVGCCNEHALKIGAMAFIHYSAMQWGKEKKCLWYCMGSTSPMVHGDYGDFKKRFGGEKFDLLSGELVLDRKAYMRKIILPAAFGVAGLLPSGLRKIARAVRRVLIDLRRSKRSGSGRSRAWKAERK